jgi:hypothetical protein
VGRKKVFETRFDAKNSSATRHRRAEMAGCDKGDRHVRSLVNNRLVNWKLAGKYSSSHVCLALPPRCSYSHAISAVSLRVKDTPISQANSMTLVSMGIKAKPRGCESG